MDTRIQNYVPTTQPRQAETSDTRQAIQRHDPDYERRKRRRDQEQDVGEGALEDRTEVSIEALQAFLADFVRAHKIRKQTQQTQPFDVLSEKAAQFSASQTASYLASERPAYARDKVANSDAAKAAGAYAQGARLGSSYAARPLTGALSALSMSERQHEQISSDLGISAVDTQRIQDLLKRLRSLKKEGVQALMIGRQASLLDAVEHAINQASS
jgi:hypothetical protein